MTGTKFLHALTFITMYSLPTEQIVKHSFSCTNLHEFPDDIPSDLCQVLRVVGIKCAWWEPTKAEDS